MARRLAAKALYEKELADLTDAEVDAITDEIGDHLKELIENLEQRREDLAEQIRTVEREISFIRKSVAAHRWYVLEDVGFLDEFEASFLSEFDPVDPEEVLLQ